MALENIISKLGSNAKRLAGMPGAMAGQVARDAIGSAKSSVSGFASMLKPTPTKIIGALTGFNPFAMAMTAKLGDLSSSAWKGTANVNSNDVYHESSSGGTSNDDPIGKLIETQEKTHKAVSHIASGYSPSLEKASANASIAAVSAIDALNMKTDELVRGQDNTIKAISTALNESSEDKMERKEFNERVLAEMAKQNEDNTFRKARKNDEGFGLPKLMVSMSTMLAGIPAALGAAAGLAMKAALTGAVAYGMFELGKKIGEQMFGKDSPPTNMKELKESAQGIGVAYQEFMDSGEVDAIKNWKNVRNRTINQYREAGRESEIPKLELDFDKRKLELLKKHRKTLKSSTEKGSFDNMIRYTEDRIRKAEERLKPSPKPIGNSPRLNTAFIEANKQKESANIMISAPTINAPQINQTRQSSNAQKYYDAIRSRVGPTRNPAPTERELEALNHLKIDMRVDGSR